MFQIRRISVIFIAEENHYGYFNSIEIQYLFSRSLNKPTMYIYFVNNDNIVVFVLENEWLGEITLSLCKNGLPNRHKNFKYACATCYGYINDTFNTY